MPPRRRRPYRRAIAKSWWSPTSIGRQAVRHAQHRPQLAHRPVLHRAAGQGRAAAVPGEAAGRRRHHVGQPDHGLRDPHARRCRPSSMGWRRCTTCRWSRASARATRRSRAEVAQPAGGPSDGAGASRDRQEVAAGRGAGQPYPRLLGRGERGAAELPNAHATSPEFVYRHRWSVGDIVLWDNRCTCHVALPDFDQSQPRLMLRCSLKGEAEGQAGGGQPAATKEQMIQTVASLS